MSISGCFPSRCFAAYGFRFSDAPGEALPVHDSDHDLRNIQPTAVFGRAMASGARVSATSCFPASSMQITGNRRRQGREYTSKTSSIRYTNSALCSGGIHHCFFSQGLSSFSQRPAHRLAGNRLDHIQLDQPVGQKPQGPTHTPGRRLAATDRHQSSLRTTVQDRLPRRGLPALTRQRCFQPFLHQPATDPFHGSRSGFQRLRRLRIGEARPLLSFVHFQQDAGQWRHIVSNHGRQWEIERPFDCPPDATSLVTIVPFNGRVLVVGNRFDDANWVNVGYGTSIDVIYDENQLYRCAQLLDYGLTAKGDF